MRKLVQMAFLPADKQTTFHIRARDPLKTQICPYLDDKTRSGRVITDLISFRVRIGFKLQKTSV